MVKKKVSKRVKRKEVLTSGEQGLIALVLAFSGFFLLVFAAPIVSLIFFVVGGIFAYLQGKKKQTLYGRRAWILNIVGAVVSVIWWIALVEFIIPYLMENYGGMM